MDSNTLKHIISIEPEEKERFKKLIRQMREKHISKPSEHVEKVFATNKALIQKVAQNHNISETIEHLRQQTYESFLIEESLFNTLVLKNISYELQTPQTILNEVIASNLDLSQPNDQIIMQIKEVCGEYAGKISPFIYELSLSNTQSRRSRAGKTFEAIIYKIYDIFSYPFESQKSIGRKSFAEQNLGKIVDSLLPSISAFINPTAIKKD